MRIVLLGASDLTKIVADHLVSINFPPVGIVTLQPTFRISYAPEGVNNHRYADMAEWGQRHGVPVSFYSGDRQAFDKFIQDIDADLALAVGWYHIIPQGIRSLTRRGCLGLHASLLPEFRGGAPLNWALLNGRRNTGITLFELGSGMDDGPIYAQEQFSIDDNDYIGNLIDKAALGACRLLDRTLPLIAQGQLTPKPQTGTPSYVLQRRPEDSEIAWDESAEQICRLVRASSRPLFGAYTHLDGERVIIWRARIVTDSPLVLGAPGQIAVLGRSKSPIVICGSGLLELEEVSLANGSDCMDECARWNNRRFKRWPSGRQS